MIGSDRESLDIMTIWTAFRRLGEDVRQASTPIYPGRRNRIES
nr:hypothetical protein JVH1_3510 [Rhodococcus sp. JVH1]